jgi:hypothetical protein
MADQGRRMTGLRKHALAAVAVLAGATRFDVAAIPGAMLLGSAVPARAQSIADNFDSIADNLEETGRTLCNLHYQNDINSYTAHYKVQDVPPEMKRNYAHDLQDCRDRASATAGKLHAQAQALRQGGIPRP